MTPEIRSQSTWLPPCFLPGIAPRGESQLPCCEDTPAAPWGPVWRDTKAYCQPSSAWATLGQTLLTLPAPQEAAGLLSILSTAV